MIVLIILGVVFMIFAAAIFFGAPYLPTLKPQIDEALDLMDLKQGQTMLELGSGDGRVMLAAARRGWKVVGYEINPLLVVLSWFVTLRYRRQVKVIWGSYWHKPWPACDGIFTFLLDKYMERLDEQIWLNCKKPVRVVSFAFKIPGKRIARRKKGMFLYVYNQPKKKRTRRSKK